MFLVLMVGTPGSSTSPPREPTVDVSCVDGGRSRISGITSQRPAIDVSCVDGGCSRVSITAS
jgi:hypothetical protein